MNILKRTFGVEFEFADVDKKAVTLPLGFSWNKEEVITNTNGKRSTFSMEKGGEINSPPLFVCQESRKKLKQVFEGLKQHGGKVIWSQGLHIHIYAGDFSLSMLKNVFLLSYYTAQYIKKIAHLAPFNDEVWQCPAPSLEYAQRVRNAKNEDEFFNIFANSMNKGYIRHLVNVPSYFVRKTIEFRCFNNTYNFSEVENAIVFSYRFINYALTHTEEDFKQINSLETFKQALKFNKQLPQKTEPLIFSGNQQHPIEGFVAKAKPLNAKMLKILIEQSPQSLACVNPFLYHTEVNLYEKTKLTIYNTDEFNHIFYRIYAEDLRIKYCKLFDFLEEANNQTVQRQIACLLFFLKLRKYTSNTEFAKKELQAQRNKITENISKFEKIAHEFVKLFENSTYILGNLDEALTNEEIIFWQNNNNSKTRAIISLLVKYSNYTKKTIEANVSYYALFKRVKNTQNFMFVSENDYFETVHKIAKSGKSIFYSTKNTQTKINQQFKKALIINAKIPADDLQITKPSELKIKPVLPSEFKIIQQKYVKKVHRISNVQFAFFVFYNDYLLGGFGFDFPKSAETNHDLFLLSDFSTNNKIFRLSKFILLCIQSCFVKKYLQRKAMRELSSCYTKVYSNLPVSMKYRGVFQKMNTEQEKYLIYQSNLGIYENEEQIIKTYHKMKQNNGK